MRSMRSRKGDRWGILTLQDMTGVLEVLAFPESFARLEPLFKSNAPLVLKGRVNVEEAGTRLAVMDGRKLEDMGQRPPSVMRVRVNLGALDAGVLDELKELFTNKPGSCAVAFDLVSAGGSGSHSTRGSARARRSGTGARSLPPVRRERGATRSARVDEVGQASACPLLTSAAPQIINTRQAEACPTKTCPENLEKVKSKSWRGN